VGVADGSVVGYQLYLHAINYTGNTGVNGTPAAPGAYTVRFYRDSELPGYTRRPDVMIDARGGFKMVTAELLKQIDVTFNNQLVRRYEFGYNENPYGDNRPGTAFNKTVLTSVSQFGSGGQFFNKHTFSYFDEARDSNGNYRGFAGTTDWAIGNDGIGLDLLGEGTASVLGGTQSTTKGGHLYVGIGPYDGQLWSKVNTKGGKVGHSQSNSETLVTMADVNGDGLPDKVFKGGGGLAYRPNLSGPNGQTLFGDPVSLPTLPAISREHVTSTTIGAESYLGLPAMLDVNRATTEADTYFSDVNGDGIPDLVTGGRVLFGYLNAERVPTFSANSADTPVPVGTGAIDTTDLLEDASAIQAERAANFPLLDTLRRWVAPYDGVVSINAPVRLSQDTSEARAQYDGADGVRVAIQLEGAELWSTNIGATDYATKTPTGVNAVPVRRGDRLYFRVQSIFDGAFDQVAWDPEITYTSVDTTRTDVNDLAEYRYKASSDFVLAGRGGATVTLPLTGTLHLGGTFEKTGATTDDATLVVTKNGAELLRLRLAAADAPSVAISQDVAVNKLDVLEWHVFVDSPIDVTRVRLLPVAYYTAADGVDRVTDDKGNFVIRVDAPYDIDFYPVSTATAPQDFYTATATGTLPVQAQVEMTGLAAGEVAKAMLTVKRRGALLAKQPITITGTGDPTVGVAVVTSANVTQGDQLFFDISSRDPSFASKVSSFGVTVGTVPDSQVVPAVLHTPAPSGLFPQPYRGWGAAGYNGNSPRDTQPIDQSVLVVNDSFDTNNVRAYPFSPRPADDLWGGVDDLAYVKAAAASSSRLGLDDIRVLTSQRFAGASAPSRVSRSENVAGSLGVGGSEGSSESQIEFQDLNGDRFPDVIGHGGVQYSRAAGGLEASTRGNGQGAARKNDNRSLNASTDGAGNIARAIGDMRAGVSPFGARPAQDGKQGSDMSPLGFGGSIGTGTSDAAFDLIDVNGDGLPDKVFNDGNVSLNLGYKFAPAEPWRGGIVNNGQSLNAGVNLGFNMNFYSLAGGLNLDIGESRSDETYVDINGDGLPDKIIAGNPLQVRLNTGTGFTTPIAWPGGHSKVALDKHISLGAGVFVTFGFAFPVPPVTKVVFNPGIDGSTSLGRPEVAFRDMDGDGYADHVLSSKDGELKVALNPLGRTNLLKKVLRPMGAAIDIEYTRDGNTYDLPQSRWTMTKVTVFDGHVGEGADAQVMTYQYQAPKYNRLERDFYGYGRVIENHLDTLNANTLYRSITREYLTDSYYTKGLLKRELLQDGQGRPFTETENTYVLRDVTAGTEPGDPLSTVATIFPKLIRTDHRFYEGQVSPGKTTFTTNDYDDFGDVTRFSDAGDDGAADDVDATIAYSTNCAATSYVIKPNSITVKGNGAEMRRRSSNVDCATGNVTQVSQYLANGAAAVTDLAYLANGNLQTVTGPTNKNGQRYTLTYEYDPVVATHVARITDSFGLSSSATHNFLFGRVETTTDTNGNQTTYAYDANARVDFIVGPYEQSQSVATLDFDYAPVETPSFDASGNTIPLTNVPWAITRHVDKDAAGNYKSSGTIDTILFTDGLKRVLQTKKDATVLEDGTSAAIDKMIASGHVSFDAFGRTTEQRYPVTENKHPANATNIIYNAAVDSVAPTVTAYDVLDRVVRTTLPDNTFTTIGYGFGTGRSGTGTRFETIVTDNNKNAGLKGAIKHTYKDVRELITSVREDTLNGPIWTSYTYDALKQITQVTDDKGNVTRIAYDNFGRRTNINNPDTGATSFAYDLASNLTQKITANLQAAGQAINYDYDFNRLIAVRYPSFTANNISYTYGAPGSPNNTAGRITKVVSHTTSTSQGNLQDLEERQYGKLGEVVYEKKTVVTFTDPLHPSVFETRYAFDTFGRLQTLIYPDGEILTNTYDSGGNLTAAKGIKNGYRYDYLKRLSYDKFEQRVLVEAGNGVKTAYTYNAQTRRLSNLTAGRSNGTLFQNLQYSYDNVGNILNLRNIVDVPPASSYGGPTHQTFVYDELYRLTHGEGTFQYAPDKTHTYAMDMAYDSIHNILTKHQLHTIVQPSTTAITQKKTSYDFTYAYNASGANSVRPHAPNHIGDRTYSYDANGNQTGWTQDTNGTRRTIVWNEENRAESITDNGHEKDYKYDDQGTRTIKRGPQGETVYVNQFFTQRPGATGTKHIYAGTTRIVSKLMKQDTVGSNPNGNTPFEKDLFFYHPDHLGTSNYVTDTNGKLYEHLEYFPFGETWVHENSNTQR
ncbi:MAG: toxin TcdB middle/N-terminal domain-containing protein, partial [Sulfurifustis sp.]